MRNVSLAEPQRQTGQTSDTVTSSVTVSEPELLYCREESCQALWACVEMWAAATARTIEGPPRVSTAGKLSHLQASTFVPDILLLWF